MTQPKIQIKLTTEQLEKLMPPGSEMELVLTSGCVENYTDRLTKRVVDKLVGKKDLAIFNAIQEAEKLVATKEWNRSAAILTQDTKDAIRREVKNEVELTVGEGAHAYINEYLSSENFKSFCTLIIKSKLERLTEELVKEYATKVIQSKLAAMTKSSIL